MRDEVDLVSIGYKHNKKKVLVLVHSKSAGRTAAEEPYLVTFPYLFGKLRFCQVVWLAIISCYSNFWNQVDVYN